MDKPKKDKPFGEKIEEVFDMRIAELKEAIDNRYKSENIKNEQIEKLELLEKIKDALFGF